MKRVNSFIIILLMLDMMPEIRGQKQTDTHEFITVDVTKRYSAEKELILQDFMDVEYIKLETNDDFLHQGFVMDIGNKIILVVNMVDDGDIFIYDRSGKALRKFNCKGQQTSREYIRILGITLDEDNNEIFVNDPFTKRILVYDLSGKFKRNFRYKEGLYIFYTTIFNYDSNHLICSYEINNESNAFIIISKKDGSITNDFKIPVNNYISLRLSTETGRTTTKTGTSSIEGTVTGITVSPSRYRTIFPFKDNWMLIDHSSDTVYTFSPNYNLSPILVRTPSIQSMYKRIFLVMNGICDRYYFMETMKFEYDWNTRSGFPRAPIFYDRLEKALYNCTVFNGDYSTKKQIEMSSLKPVKHETIQSFVKLEAFELVEDYRKGILKGRLKEIAATLDEEDNPVIMLVKHKK